MDKEEFYETCKSIDSSNCQKVIDKINEITCEDSLCDEQKLFAIHTILSKNVNEYISYLKNELFEAKLKLTQAEMKRKNIETKYKEHLEHTQKEMEKLNHIIQDKFFSENNSSQKIKKRIIVKVKRNGVQK